MASRRGENVPGPARRRPDAPVVRLPDAPPPPRSARDLLLRSWPGRLVIVATAVKLLVFALRLFVEPPRFIAALSTTATIALLVALGYFGWRLFMLVRRQLLWRVRRKLILSYIFIGVVPALAIIGFFVLGAVMISMNVSAFLFKDGYDQVVRNAAAIADAAVAEIVRNPKDVPGTISRVQQNGAVALNYAALSMGFVDPRGTSEGRVVSGVWEHQAAPEAIPTWVKTRGDGFVGSIAVPHPDRPGRLELVARAVRPAATSRGLIGHVVVDIPIDGTIIDQLYEETRVRAGTVELANERGDVAAESVSALTRSDPDAPDDFGLFDRSVAFFDVNDWESGRPLRALVSIRYRLGELYGRIMEAQTTALGARGTPPTESFILILLFFAGLFLIIQAAALTMGFALARSITSSIHELFMGTERVRHGDFGHRIDIHTKDQLGELADSFNQMTGSIENLLQTAAEKKRMEEELRIARQIQMSLLPRGPLEMPGLAVTALCVPAREVGGDYYDFFPLAEGKLGVLIADVSGKGTSAALYMAELKGLVLSLSQIYHSPRQLLLEVNRIISANLDTRSFITMTYAVLDLSKNLLTFARAGHTPLIHFAAHNPRAQARVVTPNGLVVGLRIEGAEQKFAELLEEEEIPLHNGDVIVLYTDGITEAMNSASDLFGESRLSRLVEEHGHLASGELRERILREIEAFVGPADQHDDMTMILMKVERAEEARIAV